LHEPLYVVRLDPERRHVVVGPKSALATRLVPLREVNWLGDGPFDGRDAWNIRVKVRSTVAPTDAILRPKGSDMAEVELLSPAEGISPGQACVFYDLGGSRVLGGGWIWRGY
jgi:tRNA-specific 2-thiouridylase